MATLLYGNISQKTASYTIEPGTITLPKVVQGDTFTLAVRLTETANNTTTVTAPSIYSARLSYGPVDVAPTAGTFKVLVNSVTSSDITLGSTAASVAAILNSISAATGWSVTEDQGSYIVGRTANWTTTSGITIVDNNLTPESFVRVTSYSANNTFYQELRPMQSPLAYTSAFGLIVPPAPTITRVVTGYSDSTTGVYINEVQRLYIPPAFDTTYQIYRGTARTALLNKDDGATEIQDALTKGCVTVGAGEIFLVTNPQNYTADIEFAGSMSGATHDLLTVAVPISPQGDVTFDLDLNTQGMLAALRGDFEVTHPLTCEIGINYGTVATPNVQYVTVFQQNMTVQADGAWTGLAAAQRINWLNPPQPVDYIPFTTDQVITGIQSYTAVVTGTGPWTIAHNLGTEAIHVTVRQNSSGGYILANAVDYTLRTSTSQSIVFFSEIGLVPTQGWAVMISSAGPTSAFQAHTHTIAQVVDLQDTLNAIGTRLNTLESVLPNGVGIINQSGVNTAMLTMTIPSKSGVLFAQEVEGAWGDGGIDQSKLPVRGPSLLRSFSGLANNSNTLSVPAAAGAYIYSGGIELPAMGYIPSNTVPPGGIVIYDEGRIYQGRQDGSKKTYYPVPYEVELFRVPVNANQFRVGRTLEVKFQLITQLLANTDAQWRIVIDAANLSEVTSPSPQGMNISSANYSENKLLDHRIMLTQALAPHILGVRLVRSLSNNNIIITADKNLYGTYESTTGAPTDASFILRARLMNFDISNTSDDVRGWVGYSIKGIENDTIGGEVKVTIS
jgi:class 3 adenylate cyclase